MSLINWEEAEKYTSWAMSKGEVGVKGDSWDEGADGWQRRIDFEREFTKAQVDACTRINKDTTVLDACCGTGRTAIPFAKKAKHVYAVDGAPKMLEHCRRNAESEGLDNITVQEIFNWHTLKPGEEIPLVDIAVSVIGPPQADILNFSKFATKYCYFLSFTKDRYMLVMKELFAGTSEPKIGENRGGAGRPGFSPPPAQGNTMVSSLLGSRANPSNLDIQFNILYSHGALPEITYADGAWSHEAETREEIYDYLRTLGKVDADKEEIFRANCDKRITKTESGLYRYAYESQMYVLGWDPNQLR